MMAAATVASQMARAEAVKTGLLKLHLKKAKLEIHRGGEFERMSPFVKINIGDFEWRSEVKERAGKEPEWGPLAVMEYEVRDPLAMMRIVVMDHNGMMDNLGCGHCDINVGFFAKPGGCAEWLELKFEGGFAGRIHFRSEFFPRAFDGPMVAPVVAPVFVPPVIPPMAPPMPVPEADFETPIELDLSPPMDMRKGHLKLRLNRAHIRFHEGPEFEMMKPFVRIVVEDFEWKSEHREGRNPEWGEFAVMEMDVNRPEAIMRIEVKDHQGLLDNSPLGWCEVPAHFFAREGGRVEWLELNIDGVPAGRVHFCSEFHGDILMAPPVFVPPVIPPMAPPVPVPEADFEAPIELDLSPPMDVRKGHLKLRLNRAHIRFHEGPEFEMMKPFVRIVVEDFEWKSEHREGRNPEWGEFAVMEMDVNRPEAIMRIEVKDHQGLLDNSPLGWCEVPAHFFAREGGRVEWLELNIDGVPAGRVHFCSEFHGDVMMAPPMMAAPMMDMMDGGRPGFLKVHLKHAKLDRHVGPEFQRMSPHVHIVVEDFEWRSEPAFEGGKEPNWDGQEMRMEVIDHRREMHIKVMNDGEQVGHCRQPIGFFAKAGRWSDWLELKFEGFPAGRIHFKTHFEPN